MKCPVCSQIITKKIVLYPSGSNDVESPIMDGVSKGLGNLNKVLFGTHSVVELNHSMKKITAASQSKRQNATFVAKFLELNANMFRMTDTFTTIINHLKTARDEIKNKDIELAA